MSFLGGFIFGVFLTYTTIGILLRFILPKDLWEEIKREIFKGVQG